MVFAYDGTDYHGWAKQPGLPTVQQAVEDALFMIFREPIPTVVAGRTDAGVHALKQVVHFDVPEDAWFKVPRNAPLEPAPALLRRLNGILGKDHLGITVYEVEPVPETFDARFSANRRHYQYNIADGINRWNPLRRHFCWHIREELDLESMNLGAQQLLGLHDFLSFCRPRPHSTTIRTLEQLSFTRNSEDSIEATISADAFCHNMVRALIASCVQVGTGIRTVEWLADRLAAAERTSETKLAPPHGLILTGVEYPEEHQWSARAEQTRARRAT